MPGIGRKGRWTALPLISAVALGCATSAYADPESAQSPAPGADELLRDFQSPPHAARPHVWWHWMSGNVTAEGAKLDLEWMQRIGIGGVHAFSGDLWEPKVVATPLPFMSDGWRAAYRQSVEQARAAGMDVVIAGSPGWSETGGPWVMPEQGMKKYTWAEMQVSGGKRTRIVLPAAPGITGPFQGLALAEGDHKPGSAQASFAGAGPVIAFPAEAGAEPVQAIVRSGGAVIVDLASAPTDLSRATKIAIAGQGDTMLDIDALTPVTVRAITLAISPQAAVEVEASTDGVTFRSVRKVPQTLAEKPGAQQTIAIPETRARYFRVRLAKPVPWRVLPDLPAVLVPKAPTEFVLRQLRLEGAARVDAFEAKAGFQSIVDRERTTPAAAGIRPEAVVDLTSRVKADGTLDWTPPAGKWTVVRFGWSLTGHQNGPAEPEATGLEVDKLDPVAVRDYAQKLLSLYRDKGGNTLGDKGIGALLTDSWEAGVQNWTPGLLPEFRRLRGYDPTPWLPVLAGHVVGDSAKSEAFLADFRETLKDLMVSAHYEVLAKVAHENGMTYYTEAQGDTPRAISDGLAAKARSDVPTGEFWYRPFAAVKGQPSLVADLREAASAAHLYGKPIVAAEALTVAAGNDPWSFSLGMMKPVADEIFALGVNRMLLHESHLQPFADKKPGLMLGIYGQFFNRNETWAEQARPFVDYLARTSQMLQQGRFIADIAYFYGEEENLTQRFELHPQQDVPAGYGFDYVNREVLLSRLQVRDGELVTDSGMRYRMLYVPADIRRMSLPVVRRIAELVKAGAVVVAAPPQGGLGLGSPDDAVRAEAARLWFAGGAVGKGRIHASATLADALKAEGIVPDVAAPAGANVMSVHRQAGDADIFFLTNRDDRALEGTFAFRVKGKAAQWWSAEDGATRALSYTNRGDVTEVDVPLDAKGAGFVVFRPSAQMQRKVAPLRPVSEMAFSGPWQVAFEQGRGAPASVRFDKLTDWSQSDDKGVRYFSGAATYRTTIKVERKAIGPGRRVTLDLGDVRELATVTVNGKEVGTAWHAPYRLDVSGALKPGKNTVEIKVANLWVNRLIGDKQPGATPISFAPQSRYRPDTPLRPSGLMGPVRLVIEGGR